MRRRSKLITLTFVVCLVPALLVPFLLPATYLATASVQILGKPEALTFGADFMPDTGGDRRSPLDSKMTLLLSDQVLGRVVDPMPAAEVKVGLRRRVLSALGLSSEPTTAPDDLVRRARIEGLRAAIELSEEGGGSVLMIQLVGDTPAATAFLANAVADAFVNYEVDQRETASRDAILWLNQKAAELRDQIQKREAAMNALLPKLGGRVPVGTVGGDNLPKEQISNELRSAKIELLAAEQRIAQLRPLVRVVPKSAEDESAIALRTRYDTVRTQLEEARLRYTATHPEVRRLEAVLAELEGKLGRVGGGALVAIGPQIQQEYADLEREESRLRARVSVLQGQLQDLFKSSAANAPAIAEYERLNREVSVDREMLQVLLQRSNETVLHAAQQTASSRVLDYAVMPTAPVSPNRPLVLAGGLAFAFVLALGAGVLRDKADPGVYDPEAVARALGVPLLGMIPMVPASIAAERQTTLDYATPAGEAYRNLRTSVFFSGAGRLRSLQVASAVAGEGKTTVAINLAASIAQTGRRVLLIDADLRRPRVDSVLALLRGPGLAELIRGDAKLEEVVRRPIGFEVDVVTSGEIPENPTELLESARFERILARLVEDYDLVVVDGPVLLSVSDAQLLASRVDRVLLVNKLGSVDKRAFEHMRQDLTRVRAEVIGLVVNQVAARDPYQYPSYLQSPYVSRKPGRRPERMGPTRPGKA